MFHLAAYGASIAQASDLLVAADSDPVMTIQDQGLLPQTNMEMLFAAAFSATITHAYLNSPSNRTVTSPFIRPVNTGVTFPTQGRIADYRSDPFPIKGLEVLTAYAQQGGAGAEFVRILVGLRTQVHNAPPGKIFTLRGTSTTAAVAETWTQLAVTWQDTLPAGKYAVVGMNLVGAGGIAGRCILNNQVERPGCICGTAAGIETPKMFEKGGLGLWGYFRSTQMPLIEVMCNTTTAVWTVYLDIIRLSEV